MKFSKYVRYVPGLQILRNYWKKKKNYENIFGRFGENLRIVLGINFGNMPTKTKGEHDYN